MRRCPSSLKPAKAPLGQMAMVGVFGRAMEVIHHPPFLDGYGLTPETCWGSKTLSIIFTAMSHEVS